MLNETESIHQIKEQAADISERLEQTLQATQNLTFEAASVVEVIQLNLTLK